MIKIKIMNFNKTFSVLGELKIKRQIMLVKMIVIMKILNILCKINVFFNVQYTNSTILLLLMWFF